jgi:aspartate racemase
MRLGLVGGLGPESTIDYYRRIVEAWRAQDPSSAPPIVIDSLDVNHALRLVQHDRAALVDYLLDSLQRLARAGADFAALTANTPHIVFDELVARSPIPLVSIVEVTAREAERRGMRRPVLLGTRFTMEAPFYPDVFARSHGATVIVPDEETRVWVHERYVGELLVGKFNDQTRRQLVAIVARLRDSHDVDGVILGGTELPLILSSNEVARLPVLDTTALHVAGELRCRADELLPGLARVAATCTPLADGYRLEFAPRDGVLARIASVIDRERTCCAFLRFELVVPAGGAPIALAITGPDGTRSFLDGILAPAD